MFDAELRTNMIRYTALAALVITIFWAIWSMFASVPSIEDLRLNDIAEITVHYHQLVHNYMLRLPSPISRWWDVLLAPMFIPLLVLCFSRSENDCRTWGLIGFATIVASLTAVLISSGALILACIGCAVWGFAIVVMYYLDEFGSTASTIGTFAPSIVTFALMIGLFNGIIATLPVIALVSIGAIIGLATCIIVHTLGKAIIAPFEKHKK